MLDQPLYDHVDHVECYPGVLAELDTLATAGAALVVVTNGDVTQQRMKLQHTGLDDAIKGSAISGVLGFKKADARIFAIARKWKPTLTADRPAEVLALLSGRVRSRSDSGGHTGGQSHE